MSQEVSRSAGDDSYLLNSLPIELLYAELQRRQDVPTKPACGTAGKSQSYNTGIHVFALVLILALSTLACSFPIIARRFPSLPIPHRFLFLSRHFGTGVLIATAFIHLLPTAFISMTDPCLPDFWNKIYPPMPGLIAMLAVFLVVTIEMFFATRGAGHTHSSEWDTIPTNESPRQSLQHTRSGLRKQENGDVALSTMRNSSRLEEEGHVSSNPVDPVDIDEELDDLDTLDPMADESAYLSHPAAHKSTHDEFQDPDSSDQDPHKLFLQCLLLEAGILFHSIFIGMSVSVATGTQFVVLLVAICFHQTFEGFALGSRIAALIPALFDPSSPRPWLMALAYGTTTPIGQALGIWMHALYDPASEAGLLVVGITNAISSGLLLFAGMVQLLAEDFLTDRSYKVLSGRRRIEACLSVALGAILMAIVGAFA